MVKCCYLCGTPRRSVVVEKGVVFQGAAEANVIKRHVTPYTNSNSSLSLPDMTAEKL
jgi:hypothetical protein